ncbi:hypothetical protein ACFTAO_31935 [Paenibacillus rhizoplanae]
MTAEAEPGVKEIKQFQDYSLNFLQSVLFNNPYIASVRFFVNNPRVSELWPIIYQEERIKDSPMYTKLMNQKEYALWEIQPEDAIFEDTGPLVEEQSSSMVSLAVKSNLANKQHIGIVKVEMRIEDLFLTRRITTAGSAIQGSSFWISRTNCIQTAWTRSPG